MKKTKILYWIFTGLMAAAMLFSSYSNVMVDPAAVELFAKIGQPKFMVPFLGWAKILGVLTILLPFNWRIKEWAYAGLAFDVLGATYSFIAIGEPAQNWLGMSIFILLIAASYYFHVKLQKQKHAANLNLSASII